MTYMERYIPTSLESCTKLRDMNQARIKILKRQPQTKRIERDTQQTAAFVDLLNRAIARRQEQA